MKRELGIARYGLAFCLCSKSDHFSGYNSGDYYKFDDVEEFINFIKTGIRHIKRQVVNYGTIVSNKVNISKMVYNP